MKIPSLYVLLRLQSQETPTHPLFPFTTSYPDHSSTPQQLSPPSYSLASPPPPLFLLPPFRASRLNFCMTRLQYSEKERYITGWVSAFLPCWYYLVAHSLTLLPSQSNTSFTLLKHILPSKKHIFSCLPRYAWVTIQTYYFLPLKHLTWWSIRSMGDWYQVHPVPLTVPDIYVTKNCWGIWCVISLGNVPLFSLHIVSRCGLKAWHYTCIWCRNALLIVSDPGKACMLISLCEIRQWNSNEQ